MNLLLNSGIISGSTAFKIYENIFENIKASEIHMKIDFKNLNILPNFLPNFKKISNCRIKTTVENINFYLNSCSTTTFILLDTFINGLMYTIKVENILDVMIGVLLDPLLRLRNCEDTNEALMCWSLTHLDEIRPKSLSKFYSQHQPLLDFIKIQKILTKKVQSADNEVTNVQYLKSKMGWFLNHNTINLLVPPKFIKKVKRNLVIVQKNPDLYVEVTITFLTILFNIKKYFVKKVQQYYIKECVYSVGLFDLIFDIELYGRKEEVLNHNQRKSLHLTPPTQSKYNYFHHFSQSRSVPDTIEEEDYFHLKSSAILYNLRWFFNTTCNNKKSFGLDGEYGLTEDGKNGQTFHKYDDVIFWLVTHPNTIKEVEFVVLDPIPRNYIF